jgi:hypothetical protein
MGGKALRAPTDGLVREWAVRGASGPLALELIRNIGGRPSIGIESGVEEVPDSGIHRYPVQIPVRKGDRLGLGLGPGAQVGVRADAGGRVRLWKLRIDPRRPPGDGEGYGSFRTDPVEGALRVAFTPGRPQVKGQLLGRSARTAPAGTELGHTKVFFPFGPASVAVIRSAGHVYVDLLRGSGRYSRVRLLGLNTAGRLVGIEAVNAEGLAGYNDVELVWRNPDGDELRRTLRVGAHSLLAIS